MKLSKAKVNAAMATKGYTTEKLAEEAGLSCKAISVLRAGRQDAKPQAAQMIADALGVTLDAILEVP